MCMIVFIGGMIMLILGLAGEYIGRTYISVNRAPQYVIRDKVRSSSFHAVNDPVNTDSLEEPEQ